MNLAKEIFTQVREFFDCVGDAQGFHRKVVSANVLRVARSRHLQKSFDRIDNCIKQKVFHYPSTRYPRKIFQKRVGRDVMLDHSNLNCVWPPKSA